MIKINELNDKYIKSNKRHQDKTKKLQKQIDEIKKQLGRMIFPKVLDIFKPLIDEITKDIKTDIIETYGPFGLCHETSVYWLNKKNNTLASLHFVSDGEGWALRDYLDNKNTFADGTIREMDGMNFKFIPITPEMDYKWILRFVKQK